MFIKAVAMATVVVGLGMPAAAIAQDRGGVSESIQDRQDGRRGDRARRGDRGDRGGWGRGGPGGMMGGFRGMRQLMQPDFVKRDMVLIKDSLGLDKTQQAIVETLLLDYESSFEEALDAMQDQFSDLMPEDPDREVRREKRRAVIQEMRAAGRQIREARRAAEAAGEEIDMESIEKQRQMMEKLREEMRELRPPMPEGEDLELMRESMADMSDAWLRERKQMRNQFMGDLRLQLNERQATGWDGFERELRRQKSMRLGRLSGESVDLTNVIRDLDLSEQSTDVIQPTVQEYEIALHDALGRRNTFIETSRTDMMAAMFDRDFDTAIDLTRREADLRTAVRDVNDVYADALREALVEADPAGGDAIRRAYRRAAYGRIFRPTVGMRSFDTAEQFADLDDETLVAILGMEESYLRELETANERMLSDLRAQEPKRDVQRLEGWMARMNGEDVERPEDPMRAMRTDRYEMEKRYRSQLEAVLTPEQIAELPELREPRERGRGGRGDWRNMSDEERQERREAFRQRMIEEFDADGDGELSESERETAREQMRGRGRGGDRGGRGGGRGGRGNGSPV